MRDMKKTLITAATFGGGLLLIVMAFALAAGAQTNQPAGLLPFWNFRSWQYLTLGNGFRLTGTRLDVVAPPPALVRDAALARDSGSPALRYKLPADADSRTVAVFVNGLRYHAGLNFATVSDVTGSYVVPSRPCPAADCDWDPAFTVVIDYYRSQP